MNKYLHAIVLFTCISSSTLSAELIKEYFDKNHTKLKSETNYIDGTHTKTSKGIKNGIEKIYYQEGGLAYVVNYVDGKRDGILTWFDKEGHKLSEVSYKRGLLHGREISYHTNGVIKHTVTYIDDKKEGFFKEYYDNGILALRVEYINNKKEGLQQEYTYKGKLYSEVFYKNNYKEGLQKWYDENGKVIKSELFKHDRPVNVMKQIQDKTKKTQIIINSIDFSPQKPQ